jgi:pSer/pThr/pTyr-binding forkhead associated (FHA) protein
MAGSPIPAEPVGLNVGRRLANGALQSRGLVNPAEEAATVPEGQDRQVGGRWKGGRLVVIVEDGSEGKSFSLAEGQLDIGRTEGDIVLEDDPYVSPRHARLRRAETSWILRDLDSVNRVYVRLRKAHPLRDGDLLLLGLEVLQFQTVSDGERGHGHAIQHGTFVFGSPAARGSFARARLCQRTVEGVIRDVYHLFRDETIIGREVGDIVFTADPFLSRKHAAIRRNPVSSEFSLVDLESSNGTYIAIRGEVPVGNGDYLRIGQHLFRVDLG